MMKRLPESFQTDKPEPESDIESLNSEDLAELEK